MLNGCLTQLSFLVGIIAFAFLALLTPIRSVSNTIIQDFDQPTETPTFVPSPTDLQPTETTTSTPTFTATPTITASATLTATPTNTLTPTDTATSTNTPTATATFTPSFTPTPTPVCSVRNNRSAMINVRSEAFAGSDLVAQLPIAAEVDVYAVSEQVDPDGYLWYYIETVVDDAPITGWIREDVVDELTPCVP